MSSFFPLFLSLPSNFCFCCVNNSSKPSCQMWSWLSHSNHRDLPKTPTWICHFPALSAVASWPKARLLSMAYRLYRTQMGHLANSPSLPTFPESRPPTPTHPPAVLKSSQFLERSCMLTSKPGAQLSSPPGSLASHPVPRHCLHVLCLQSLPPGAFPGALLYTIWV